MKAQTFFFIVALIAGWQGTVLAQHHYGGNLSSTERNPALAAVLSLQPLPVDLGSFYAGNWERGILYTAAEVAMFVPAMILMSENWNSWGHHHYDPSYDNVNRRSWTSAERKKFYYLLSGYVLVKIISAFDAGYSVERQNAGLVLGYNESTKSVALSINIPIAGAASTEK